MHAEETIQFKKLHPDATIPTRGTENSAGFDLYALEDTLVVGGAGSAIVPTGIAAQAPEGTYLRVAMRSGHAAKHHLHAGAGVIDIDYTGGVGVVATCTKIFDLRMVKAHQDQVNVPTRVNIIVSTRDIVPNEGTIVSHVGSLAHSEMGETVVLYPVLNPYAYVIKKGERFAQLIPEKISYGEGEEVENFRRSYASHEGYGSTGSGAKN